MYGMMAFESAFLDAIEQRKVLQLSKDSYGNVVRALTLKIQFHFDHKPT